jgi:hypothetical protein
LRVQGPRGSQQWTLPPQGEAIEPSRGVARVFAAKNCEAEFGSRQQGASDGIRRQRPRIDAQPFHEQKRTVASRSNISELPKESSRGERQVEVADAFALDQGVAAHVIVTCVETAMDDNRPKGFECHGYPAGFAYIDHDRRLARLSRHDRLRVIDTPTSTCAYSSREVRRK